MFGYADVIQRILDNLMATVWAISKDIPCYPMERQIAICHRIVPGTCNCIVSAAIGAVEGNKPVR